MAKEYSVSNDAEKHTIVESALSILQTKTSFSQILFSIGTLSYSILFATSGVLPDVIGWFGIVASIIYGFGSAIVLAKPNFRCIWSLGGLLILLFE